MPYRFTLAVALLGLITVTQTGNEPAKKEKGRKADRIALLDMSEVFKHSSYFEAKMAQLKEEVGTREKDFRKLAEQIQTRTSELQQLIAGTPEHATLEEELLELKRKAEDYGRKARQDLQQEEAEIYRATYVEIHQTVDDYAKEQGYTIVMRFTRRDLNHVSTPKDVLETLNQGFITYEASRDITDEIIQVFNEKHNPKL